MPLYGLSSRVRRVSESAEPARLVNVRRFLMGITTDNSLAVLPLLSPDVVYSVPGQGPLAGVFRGPAEVYEHVGKLFSATSSTLQTLKWVDWLVGLSHVAALQFAQAQGGGVIYRNHHMYVVETGEDDLLSNIRVFFEDQTAADTFFASLSAE
jgi:ketosteroid isomerase-like protein